MSKITNSFRDI